MTVEFLRPPGRGRRYVASNPDDLDANGRRESRLALSPGVALTREVVDPSVHVFGGRDAHGHILAISSQDAKAGAVQVEVDGRVVALSDAAATPLA